MGSKKKRSTTRAGLIYAANNANFRYLCLLSAACLLKSPWTQDGCDKASSAETPGLAGSLTFGCVYSQPEAVTSRSTRGLARYISPRLDPDVTESTTPNPTGRMGPVPPLRHLGSGDRPKCTVTQLPALKFLNFTDIPCRNSGPSSPR